MKKSILLLLISIAVIVTVKGQSLYVFNRSGQQTSYFIDQTRSVSFQNDEVKINLKSGDVQSIPFIELRKMTFMLSTGVPATEISHTIKIFPNPAVDYFNILPASDFWAKNINVKIRTIDGKLVYNQSYENHPEENIRLNISTWNKGVYIIYIHDGEKTQVKKLIKN